MAKKSQNVDTDNSLSTIDDSVQHKDNEINEKQSPVVETLETSPSKQTTSKGAKKVEDSVEDDKSLEKLEKIPQNNIEIQLEQEDNYTADEFETLSKMYSETLPAIEDKQVLNGTVVRITEKVVVVDINFKSDGVINSSEFKYNNGSRE